MDEEATMKYLFALATVAAVAVLGGVAACGGEERLSRDEFSDRLESIDERGGELWARLAQRARNLEPGEPLPGDVKQALRELVDFQDRAAAGLEGLDAPEGAEEPVELLIRGLRGRTETFENAIEAGHFTEQDFQRVTRSGEEIDRASGQLRQEGFLPASDEHDEE